MVIVSLMLVNFIVFVGAYAMITWLSGEDVLQPIRAQKDPAKRPPSSR